LLLSALTETKRDIPIEGLTADSRQVREGYLFAALPGSKQDGAKFISDAIDHGARVILAGEDAVIDNDDIILIRDKNPRRALAKIAARYYNLQPKVIVAVTGTSGKTSTVSFTQQLWNLAGIKHCASLGTLGIRAPGMNRYGSLTTPDTVNLHAQLADLAAAGITHLAMEASSHGLDQYRLDGVTINAAAYTNLSRDHLDYHADMDEYFAAKARLFTEILPPNGTAVIHSDDPYGKTLIEICRKKNIKTVRFGSGDVEISLQSRAAAVWAGHCAENPR
jgi:UDP-N-acetylmuramoyl-L-alanyl-D-glutamate--2,6-diaminopimelate ligase